MESEKWRTMNRMFNPPHPGEVLRGWILETMTVTDAADTLKLSRVTVKAKPVSAQYDLWPAEQKPPAGILPLERRVA
jgi:hypothetical protein